MIVARGDRGGAAAIMAGAVPDQRPNCFRCMIAMRIADHHWVFEVLRGRHQPRHYIMRMIVASVGALGPVYGHGILRHTINDDSSLDDLGRFRLRALGMTNTI